MKEGTPKNMSKEDFEAAFNAPVKEPNTLELETIYDRVFRETKDVQTAMVAVNRLLKKPISYDDLRNRIERESAKHE